ncbi:hypothetical protein Tco_0754130 [Tanacetum coccineum]
MKFQMDLQVVEEEVADEPNSLGRSQSITVHLTLTELRTDSCDLHELRRIWFPTCGGEESLSCQLLASSLKTIPKWSLYGPVNASVNISSICFASPDGEYQDSPISGGSRRDVVVVIAVTVAVDVGSGA